MLIKDILVGDIVKKVEEQIRNYYKVPYCTLVATGTAALEVALKALELPRGSKVILPDISFIATATAVANVGLLPVYADCSDETWGISIEEVERIYEKYEDVKACIVVHFSGIVNRDIEKIAQYCKEKNLYLIEDCAQVFGAGYQDTRCGMFGDIGTFSFQASKVITCGEGGMVISSNEVLANKVQALADWGLDLHGERQLSLPCSNARINQFAASFLMEQIESADDILKERINTYQKCLEMVKAKGAQVQFTAQQGDFHDMPFFMLLKAEKDPVCVLHPIDEYPMHLSKLVRSIIRVQYPDMLEEYDRIIAESDYSNSIRVVNTTEFVPLCGVTEDNMEEKFEFLLGK